MSAAAFAARAAESSGGMGVGEGGGLKGAPNKPLEGVCEGVCEGVAKRNSEAVGVPVPLPVGVTVPVFDGVLLGEAPTEREDVGEGVLESVAVSVGDAVTEGVGVPLSEPVGAAPGVSVLDAGAPVAVGQGPEKGVDEGEGDEEGVTEPVPTGERVPPGGSSVDDDVGVSEVVGVLDSEVEGVLDGDTPGSDVLEGVGVLDHEREEVGVAEGAVSSTMI